MLLKKGVRLLDVGGRDRRKTIEVSLIVRWAHVRHLHLLIHLRRDASAYLADVPIEELVRDQIPVEEDPNEHMLNQRVVRLLAELQFIYVL